jgi:uncharacterized membrane protein YsdA (DUF1294 family)
MSPATTLLAYFLVINFATLFIFWLDKRRSAVNKSRIPGRNLLTLVAIGGTFGGWRAMSLYNVKSRNSRFRTHFAIIAVVQLCIALLFLYNNLPQTWKDAAMEALNV